MKKIILSLTILCLSLIVFTNEVMALDLSSLYSITRVNTLSLDNYIMKVNPLTLDSPDENQNIESSSTFRQSSVYKINNLIAFCIDSNGGSFTGSTSGKTYKVSTLAENYTDSEIDEYFVSGITSIFDYFNLTEDNVNTSDYIAQLIALRVFTTVFNNSLYINDDAVLNNDLMIYRNLFIWWYNNSVEGNSNALSSNGMDAASYILDNVKSSTGYNYFYKNGETYNYKCNTNTGLCDSSSGEYVNTPWIFQDKNNSGILDKVLSAINVALESMETASTEKANLTYYKSDENYVTLTAQNFSETGGIVKLDITADSSYSCTVNGVVVICDNELTIKNGYVLRIEFNDVEYTTDTLDCEDYAFEISYTIDDQNSGGTVYLAEYSNSNGASSTFQRFLFYDNDNLIEIKDSFDTCKIDCDPDYKIISDCQDEMLDGTEENEWYSSSYLSNQNILSCIINKTDEAGNSLVAKSCSYDIDLTGNTVSDLTNVDNGMSDVENNPYCTVSCSEDYYDISFPGVQSTDSGRYFKIGATISARKNCYTSEIKYSSFVADIIEAQEIMIEAYNNYQSFSIAAETYAILNTKSCEVLGDGKPVTTTYKDVLYGYTNSNVIDNDNSGNRYNVNSLVVKTFTGFNGIVSKSTGAIASLNKNNNYEAENDLAMYTGVPCYNPSNGTIDYTKEELEESVASYKAEFEKARANFEEIIKNISSCAGGNTVTSNFSNYFTSSDSAYLATNSYKGWEMIFGLNPNIEYTYYENFGTGNVESSYMNLSGLKTDKNNYLQIVSNSNYVNGTFGDTTYTTYGCLYNAGECSGIDYNSADNSSAYATRKFAYCTLEKGCETITFYNFPTEEIKISSAEVDKTLEYETPEVFYTAFPSGTIIYSDDSSIADDDGNDVQVELVDGLPVNIKTEQGAYQFSYIVSNLGEYYDTCEGGRINEELSVLEGNSNLFSDTTFDYVCYYKVNCPYCDVTTSFNWPDSNCVTCIVNGTFTMYFRTISTSNKDALSNDRELGYNWNYNYTSDTVYGFISSKANATFNEIYDLMDNVYDGTPILEVSLTPSLAKEIREYNSSSSSYSDDTLTCLDYNEYANIFCYSELLTEWSEDYSTNFEFSVERDPDSNSDVSVYSNNSTGSSYWTVYTTDLEQTTYFIGGPSWK